MSDHPTTAWGRPSIRPRRCLHARAAAPANRRQHAATHRRGPSPGSAPSGGPPDPRRADAGPASPPPPVPPGIPRRSPASHGSTRPPSAPTTTARPMRRAIPAGPVPARARAAHALPGTVHRHAVASGQTAALGGLAPVALLGLRSADQPRRGPTGRALQQPGGPGQPAAAGLLPDRAAVAEGRRRQNHDHRDAGIDLRLRSAATGWWPSTPTPTAAP